MKIMSAVPSKKSLFVKKSKFVTSSGSKALLNFCSPNSDELNNKIKYVKIELDESSCQNKKNFTFVFSDNNFRFGFDKGKL